MLLTEIKRIIKFGYSNFTRRKFTSVASILVMTVTLFVITSLIFVQASLNASLNNLKEKVDVTVYFVPGASEPAIQNIETSLDKLPEVRDITYTSEDEALASFKEKHANDYLTLQALNELDQNPLGASLNIKAQDPSQYESISNYFSGSDSVSKEDLNIVDKVDYNQNKEIIERLVSIINGTQKLGYILSLIFIIISIIITYNTIRIIIFMSKEEIEVMRLVGSGVKYIQGPFVVSGILVGVAASLITLILFFPLSMWLGNHMTNFLGIDMYSYYISNFFQLFIIMFISGIILGAISSSLAVMRYLKK